MRLLSYLPDMRWETDSRERFAFYHCRSLVAAIKKGLEQPLFEINPGKL
jgi:hypothetical protein